MTPVFPCVLDHLVIGARSLEEGRSFVADLLGVSPVAGGTHPHMGTHNVLLSLGGSVYLEVIAVDPEAEPPDRPRWFSLDNPNILQALKQGPRLLTWVARTPDLAGLVHLAPYATCKVCEMSRGDLRWLFAFTEDGECPGGGLLPHVIEWRGSAHPTDVLPESGCHFSALRGHFDDSDSDTLARMGLESIFTGQTSGQAGQRLSAVIKTPRGEITF